MKLARAANPFNSFYEANCFGSELVKSSCPRIFFVNIISKC